MGPPELVLLALAPVEPAAASLPEESLHAAWSANVIAAASQPQRPKRNKLILQGYTVARACTSLGPEGAAVCYSWAQVGMGGGGSALVGAMARVGAASAILAMLACGSGADAGTGAAGAGASSGAGPSASTGATTGTSTSTSASGGGSDCPQAAGVVCVDKLPFHYEGDTAKDGVARVGSYACNSIKNELGPEIAFRVPVPAGGAFLSAAVYAENGIDIDVHLLASFDPAAPSGASCLDRGDHQARADVAAGYAWVLADSFVSGGVTHSGPFTIDIGLVVPSHGPCAMQIGEMARIGDNGTHLAMPATGPIVMEAHLVTQAEPPPYPATATEHLTDHYKLSQAATGLVMYRTQVWAPLEGGSFYGAGIGSPTEFPVVDEGWYVNMLWTAAARPKKGTRMILRDPNGGSRAVVVAAGYETGPGNLAHIAGTPEESHFYLGTTHLAPLKIGIAADGALPLGPRVCDGP